jgi:acetyl-CoA C-acetyltransferase
VPEAVIVATARTPIGRAVKGSLKNPVFASAQARAARAAGDGAVSWSNPREDGAVPDIYIAMGQTAENLALLKGIPREEMDQFGVRSQNLAEKALANGFCARDHVTRSA